MAWTLTDDLDAYAAAVDGLLSREPERYTVLMSVLATLISQGPTAYGARPPVLGWWSSGGAVDAAVLCTPPHPVVVTTFPDRSADELATILTPGHAALLTGVLGAEPPASAFASAWSAATGAAHSITQRQRLYRLGALTPPRPAPDGAARIATPADADVVHAWETAFCAETGQRAGSPAASSDRLRHGQVVLWEVAGEVAGEPVSMAAVTPARAGVARIGPVYTPAEHRRRGFAGGVTAASTRLALDRGADRVVLFTDLANPNSNALYIRLGYVPVEDKVLISFDT
jgi:predicted GNAT family acetyltransferase